MSSPAMEGAGYRLLLREDPSGSYRHPRLQPQRFDYQAAPEPIPVVV